MKATSDTQPLGDIFTDSVAYDDQTVSAEDLNAALDEFKVAMKQLSESIERMNKKIDQEFFVPYELPRLH